VSGATGRTSVVVGTLAGRFPVVRIGSGPAPLAVLPGMALTNEAPRGLTAAAYGRGFSALARGRTLLVVLRPQGLAEGTSTGDLAGEYAAVLDAELGRYDLVGLSTGGLIAQHLALQRPDAVRRLALVVAGARIDAEGRRTCRRWLELVGQRRWRRLHGDLAAAAVDGPVLRGLARTVLGLTGRTPTATEAADFTTTVRAVLDHDTSAALTGLRVPALVLGGELDPFFPAAALAATAAAVPQAQLHVVEGCGHGVPKQRAGEVQRVVAGFLGTGP
jgi:pimeloyl-ACP methyl ester carboxylesterase